MQRQRMMDRLLYLRAEYQRVLKKRLERQEEFVPRDSLEMVSLDTLDVWWEVLKGYIREEERLEGEIYRLERKLAQEAALVVDVPVLTSVDMEGG